MALRVGVDIVRHKRFASKLKDDALMARLFSAEEMSNPAPEHLAGFFAAKEAAVKALGIAAGSWLSLRLSNDPTGRPRIEFLAPLLPPKAYDLSIAHDGDYTIAMFVAEVE
jgi:holo-[acyl-carrier protein] synthase